jgi:non-lysosomal glucosylceramidase
MKFNDTTRSFDASHTAVAFPLGGIGTGNVSLGARGDLRDWEIFNKPAKGNILPNAFFAIRTRIGANPPVARVLEGPAQPPYTESHGYHPVTNKGLARCARSTFKGEYPFAQVELEDPELPVSIRLLAYTPLIPLNPEDSGIPCAILTYTLTNTGSEPVDLTLVGSLLNPCAGLRLDPFMNVANLDGGSTRNEFRQEGRMRGLFLSAEGIDPQDVRYGSMSLVTDHPNITVKPAWLRGPWYDFLQDFWDDFVEDGLLTDLNYSEPPADNRPDTGSVGLIDTLAPGEKRDLRFVLTWHFPNRPNTWITEKSGSSIRNTTPSKIIRNHYATRFDDAWDVARYVIADGERLEQTTRQFHAALFGSTLPPAVLDAISANIVPARSTTCFWLEDGRFYGWEGCFDDDGCCPGTCTHVWSYAYTIAHLFPSLEREMRRIEFEIETEADGFMQMRNLKSMGDVYTIASLNEDPTPASDGQLGSIIRCWREWQLSGDRAWLESIWPGIKRSVDYASATWDTDQDGVLDGKQHNTYDIEFYGPNPLSGIYYLAALRAVEELAKVMGEDELAERCRTVFTAGSGRLDDWLWNGNYYIQKLDDVDAYKYQHGIGCLSDQLLGQLHAHVLGLGDLLPREHARQAVKSIFDHNFRADFTGHMNCQRAYVFPGEAGLLMCTWPQGGRPRLPFVYSDEVWTGVEYQVAAHLIAEGWVDEGLQIVAAVRDRHDGIRRNPWNEVECGHHYARSMSSWLVLLALTGAQADVAQGILRFHPCQQASTEADEFRTFWSTGTAWGVFRGYRDAQTGEWRYELDVLDGALDDFSVYVGDVPLDLPRRTV